MIGQQSGELVHDWSTVKQQQKTWSRLWHVTQRKVLKRMERFSENGSRLWEPPSQNCLLLLLGNKSPNGIKL